MTPQQQQALIRLLGTPAFASMSDAAAAAAASTPVVSPATAYLNFTSLAAPAVWGVPGTAAFRAALTALAANTTLTAPIPGTSPAITVPQLAQWLLGVLSSTGINPQDPQVATYLSALVAAGVITQAQASAALTTSALPIGVTVAAADVTAARAVMTAQASVARLATQAKAAYQNAQRILNTAKAAAANGTAPNVAAITAALAAGVVG